MPVANPTNPCARNSHQTVGAQAASTVAMPNNRNPVRTSLRAPIRLTKAAVVDKPTRLTAMKTVMRRLTSTSEAPMLTARMGMKLNVTAQFTNWEAAFSSAGNSTWAARQGPRWGRAKAWSGHGAFPSPTASIPRPERLQLPPD